MLERRVKHMVVRHRCGVLGIRRSGGIEGIETLLVVQILINVKINQKKH
jgi:hypothetical protein